MRSPWVFEIGPGGTRPSAGPLWNEVSALFTTRVVVVRIRTKSTNEFLVSGLFQMAAGQADLRSAPPSVAARADALARSLRPGPALRALGKRRACPKDPGLLRPALRAKPNHSVVSSDGRRRGSIRKNPSGARRSGGVQIRTDAPLVLQGRSSASSGRADAQRILSARLRHALFVQVVHSLPWFFS